MTTHLSDRLRLNERATTAISFLIVSGMMMCAAIPVLQLARRFAPGWEGSYLVSASGLVAFEALVAWRAASQLTFPGLRWFLYRGAELIVIFISLKTWLYSRRGFDQFWADLPRWSENFNNFFDGEYLFSLLVVLTAWVVGSWFASVLMELEGDEHLWDREHGEPLFSDRAEARRQLIGGIFVLGGVMLALTALVRSNLSFLGIQAAYLRTGLLNVVLYFVLGLILLSLSQLAVLRARWSLERIPLRSNLAARWAVYTLILLIVVAAVVSLLPTNYSLGLLGTLNFLIGGLVALFYLVILLMGVIFGLLLRLLALLFGGQVLPRPIAPPPMLPPPPLAPATSITWVEVLKSLFFWIVFLGILGYSIYYYLRQRQDLLVHLRRLPGWSWLVQALRWLGGGVGRLNRNLVEVIQAGWRRLHPATTRQSPGYFNLRRLSPRERVQFFYRAMVRRGGESGVPRKPAQTPFEYESTLRPAVPESEGDLSELTRAFVQAQYSPHPITSENAVEAQGYWERIKKALRTLRLRQRGDRE